MSHLTIPGLIGSVIFALTWICITEEKTREKRSRTDLNNRTMQNDIDKKLARKLMDAETTDFDRFDKARRLHLSKLLSKPDTHVDLVRAVLSAWERAGDRDANPFVAKLAAGQARAATNPDIGKQARECLLALQERAAQENNAGTLLRASTPAHTPEELLRPAFDTPSNLEANAQLL